MYWYNYISGTDDSLTLVDYLMTSKTEIPLSEIFNDTGLSKLNWNFHISPNFRIH
ncbi:MAG: imm68 putative immunity domain-containing protein [Oscillospiraceae bacterium]